MKTKSYQEALLEINKKSKTTGEQEVNLLFLNLGFTLIDCNAKFYRKTKNNYKEEIGEIDGIFCLEDQYLVLIEVDNSKRVESNKINKFFNKWGYDENLEFIKKQYDIHSNIEVIRIYVACKEEKPRGGLIKSSLKHIENEYNNIMYNDDFKYYQNSFKVIGAWAKNELLHELGLIFRKKTEEKDAIRVPMGTETAYLFSATAEELLKTSYIYRKNESSLGGYQRILKTNRINQIQKQIKKGKILAFPNSIILSSQFNLKENFERKPGSCKINFPTSYLSFKVVDGQHRLMGFANLGEKEQKEHYLPVVAFEELNKEDELKTFITINTEQKNIDPNLLLILKADMNWEETDKFYVDKICTQIVNKLNDDKNFFLNKKIFLGYNFPKKNKITLTTLVQAIKKNNLVGGKLHLLQNDINDIESPFKEIKKILNALKQNLGDYCVLSNSKSSKGFFLSNNGLKVVFRLIQFFIRNKQKGNVSIDYKEFFSDISSTLREKDVEDLMENYGEGGANKATEEVLDKLKKNFKKSKKYTNFKSDLRSL